MPTFELAHGGQKTSRATYGWTLRWQALKMLQKRKLAFISHSERGSLMGRRDPRSELRCNVPSSVNRLLLGAFNRHPRSIAIRVYSEHDKNDCCQAVLSRRLVDQSGTILSNFYL